MFIGIVVDNGDSDGAEHLLRGAVRRAIDAATYSLPATTEQLAAESWYAPSRRVALLAWSNDADALAPQPRHPLIVPGDRRAHGWTGYFSDHAAERAMRESADPLTGSAGVGGCFAYVRATDDTVEGVTTATSPEAVYYCQSPGIRVVGSRALLTHLVANAGTEAAGPRFQSDGLRGFANNGYFLGDDTPFAGVQAVPPSSRIRLATSGTARLDTLEPEPRAEPSSGTRWRSTIRDTADALVTATEPLRDLDAPISVALTGGRDSRLIAAALHAAKIPFRATTNGLPGHPDVDIAELICADLGIDHRVNPPRVSADQTTMRVEAPDARTRRILDFTDGMTSGWDDVSDYGPPLPSASLSGLGGEILRGGYVLSGDTAVTPDRASTVITNTFAGSAAIFTSDANDYMRALASPWLEAARTDPQGTLDDLYITNRVGRWGAARRTAATVRAAFYTPLLDNLLITNVRRVPAAVRWQERLVWEVLDLLAPSLADLPIEGGPWRFDADPSTSPRLQGRPVPEVRVAEKVGSGYDWRRLDDPALHAQVRRLVLDGIDHEQLTDVIVADQVVRFLDAVPPRIPQHAWYLLSTVQLLQERWWDPIGRSNRQLTFDVTMAR